MMRQLIEDALITYWQEEASLFAILAPALVLGPTFVLIAGTGLPAALTTLPFFLLLYLATYAACVRASGLVLGHLGPGPKLAYSEVLIQAGELLRATGPGALLLGSLTGAVLLFHHYVDSVAPGMLALVGAGAFLLWVILHAYDLPLMLAHHVPLGDIESLRTQLLPETRAWTLTLLLALALPLLLAGLVSWGLAAAIDPIVGGAIFVLALALWLPLPALTLTATCAHLVGATE